jgi:hypothetical protein
MSTLIFCLGESVPIHPLKGIIGIDLPEPDFPAVSAEDKASLEPTTVAAEQKLNDLVNELIGKGYYQARLTFAGAAKMARIIIKRFTDADE